MQPKLDIQTLRIGQLIEDFSLGQIVVPEFQRGYVWKPSKAAKLLNSLYHGFPIASLLLWQSSEIVRSRSPNNNSNTSYSVNWLIDGQQRLSTLSRINIGNEDGGMDVVFNADTQEFSLTSAATKKDRSWLEFAEIWDSEQYRQLRRSLVDHPKSRLREARLEQVKNILEYEVPCIRMVGLVQRRSFSIYENKYYGDEVKERRY